MKIIDTNEVIPYSYDKLKVDGFEEIINSFLEEAPTVFSPVFVHMLGIPAAGKSTFYRNNLERFKNFVFISFDTIMEAHSQYQTDVQELGSVEAFKKWEIPARIAGYELLNRAVAAKKNIFFDHSGAPKCHQELLINVKKLGYKTEMYYISCPVEVAIKRAQAREVVTKRHTPIELITSRIKLIENHINIYKSIVDEFFYVK